MQKPWRVDTKNKDANPCYGCTEGRSETCHSTCREYLEWSEKRRAKKEEQHRQYVLERIPDEYRKSVVNKEIHKRNKKR